MQPDAAVEAGYEEAKAKALRLLGVRPRTEAELGERLERAGFEPDDVARVLRRLRELGLVDDLGFARQWVRERARRGLARRALASELRAKGVDPSAAEVALDELGGDDQTRADELATGLVGKLAGLPTEKQVARLRAALLRKGFSYEVTAGALRAVLPPEGWD